MSDNRGKGPNTPGDDGRIERNPSRPYENKPAQQQQDKMRQGANEALKKK